MDLKRRGDRIDSSGCLGFGIWGQGLKQGVQGKENGN